jgi:DNA-directed RNA polymerase subunit RPC12/RpoP
MNWTDPDLKLVSQTTTVRLSESAFAKGAMRTAHAMIDTNTGSKAVAKVYFKVSASKAVIDRDVQSQSISKAIAREFLLNKSIPSAVDFIFTSYYKLLDCESSDPMQYFGSEPFIAGEYVKYNNNNGWKNVAFTDKAQAIFSDTAQAFSHYSWQFTYGNLMVVDLQGVNHVLTDPQIHTQGDGENKFGEGNLGDDGIAAFFATHTCNDVCKALKLVPFSCGESTVCSAGVQLRSKDETTSTEFIGKKKAILVMEMSCSLCGDIFETTHAMFVEENSKGRDIYCAKCATQIAVKRTVPCGVCKMDWSFSAYWYRMCGMEMPKSCKLCKKKGAAAAAEAKKSDVV